MNPIIWLRKKYILKTAQKSPYFNEFFQKVDLNQRVEEATFVVFDCEATDLNVKKAELLSVGAFKVRNFSINLKESFEAYLQAGSVRASEIHGITKEDLEKLGRPPKAVIKEFLKYIKGSILVGFFLKFDVGLIEKYSLEFFGYPIPNYKLDIFNLYKSSYGKVGSLEDLAREFGLETKGRHTALNDAYITALVFMKILKGYKGRKVGSLPIFV